MCSRLPQIVLTVWLALAGSNLHAQFNVLTANYGNDRTNANLKEKILNTSNVSSDRFGKLFSLPVDGQIYAQPLYVGGIAVPRRGVKNIVYTATMHNSVYAFDADSGSLIWRVSLGTPVLSSDYNFPDIDPEVGILSTPVIDPLSGVIYVVANVHQDQRYSYWLHALDLATGMERMNGPVEIQAAVSGKGRGSTEGTVVFNPFQHLQRPGLLLLDGVIFVAFGSHADQDPYHGWIMGYNAADLTEQTGVFNSTPNGADGGIWQSGRGLAADDEGNIFAIAGNGDFDGHSNFGESFLRLSGPQLTLTDWFTPHDWNELIQGDLDMGTAGPVLVSDRGLILGASKWGILYVVDRNNMGGIRENDAHAVQVFRAIDTGGGGIFNLAVWSTSKTYIVYLQGRQDGLKAYCLIDRNFSTTPCSVNSSLEASARIGMAVSADGDTPGTGILWVTTKVKGSATSGTLHAFDASDVSKELWNSDLSGESDALGEFAKFATPTIAAGKVYVPTFSGQLVVYGLK